MEATLKFPTPEAVLGRPADHQEEVIAAERAKTQAQIEELEVQLSALQDQLDNPAEEVPNWHKNCSPEEIESINNRAKERKEDSKRKVFDQLGKIALGEDESVEANYTEWVDYDLAGGHGIQRHNQLSLHDGVYLMSIQTTFPNDNRALKRDPLLPYWEQYILHPDLSEPLKVDSEGELEKMNLVDVSKTQPQEWETVEREIVKGLEAIRASQLIAKVISVIDMNNLKPMVYPNGKMDESILVASREVSLNNGLAIRFKAKVDVKTSYYPSRNSKSLSHIEISFVHGENIKEFYVIDAKTLGVNYQVYDSGNSHLHNEAEALIDLGLSALEKNETDS